MSERDLIERLEALREIVGWYGRTVENCRKITSEGQAARAALDRDGGQRATGALATIARLSETLAEAEKKGAEDWQPIETAPKDGAPILLGRFTGQKSAKNEGHICVDWWRRPEDEMGYVGFGFFNPTHWPATHWRPLPVPPARRKKGQ